MAWPSLVTPGQRILASDFNAIITSFSSWADSVNSVLNAMGGAPTFNAAATFNGSVTFAVAPTFTDAAGTRANLGISLGSFPTLSGANTFTGTATFNAAVTFASSSPVTMNGSFTASQPVTFSGGVVSMTRPAAYANSGASWVLNIQNAAATDNLSFGQTGASYTTGGTIGWLGNSNAFLYFNSGQDLRIGCGVGSNPMMAFKGNGRILIGTLTDNGADMLQVAGAVYSNGFNLATPANFTIGTGWLAWSATISGWNSMTVSGVTTQDAQYIRLGPFVYFKMQVQMTLGGTASNQIFISAPIAIAGNLSFSPCVVKQSAAGNTWSPAWAYLDPAGNLIKILLPGEGSFTLGTAYVLISGFYRCV